MQTTALFLNPRSIRAPFAAADTSSTSEQPAAGREPATIANGPVPLTLEQLTQVVGGTTSLPVTSW